MKTAALAALLPLMSPAATPYLAEHARKDGVEIVRLTDPATQTVVSVVPSVGNIAFEMLVRGTNILHFPFPSLAEFREKPALGGVPLLAPWANRLDEDGFWANGKHYLLHRDLNNLRIDSFNHPIHGLLAFSSHWEVVALHANRDAAEVTSKLEFWRYPDLMAQFPFAHTIYMTYRLHSGTLETRTRIENLSTDPMPVSIGFHPYFTIRDAPRDSWTVQIPAKEQVVLSRELVPTGEMKPNPHQSKTGLQGIALDDVFSGLMESEGGRTEFWVTGAHQRISVLYGPKYPVAVVFAPPGRDFICFEPMSGPTNAFNLHHAGKYQDLQSIPPGGKWEESFWIKSENF